jgi:hypothetical protein
LPEEHEQATPLVLEFTQVAGQLIDAHCARDSADTTNIPATISVAVARTNRGTETILTDSRPRYQHGDEDEF